MISGTILGIIIAVLFLAIMGYKLSKTKPKKRSIKISSIEFNESKVEEIFGKTIKENDLTLIEGISTKTSILFRAYGITSWYVLSMTTVSRCQEILNTNQNLFSSQNPNTWPLQAEMAAHGEWQALQNLQNSLS